MSNIIWWIRRDLRLADNEALKTAVNSADKIIPLFILDPVLLHSPYVGAKRLAFLFDGLRSLDNDLRMRNSQLIIRRGEPLSTLIALSKETNAVRIIAEEDYTPYARARDARIANALPLQLVGGVTVARPDSILKANGEPYTVFTPYSRKWKEKCLPVIDDIIQSRSFIPTLGGLHSVPIPLPQSRPISPIFQLGEREAQKHLNRFTTSNLLGIFNYAVGRNRLDQEGTSKLSPYLRFGMISAKQAVVYAQKAIEEAPSNDAIESANIWLNELIWREFYIHILYHFPKVHSSNFRPEYDYLAWDNNEDLFAAWCEGQTGYPIIDAAMRQLTQTGWMHNRARMIVASFLVKDLLVDWRWGEKFFMQHLIDGDPSANNGGWQWSAGTGTDAAPYFRIFNPVLQGKKYDPDGNYVRRWVPELSMVPNRYIQAPWEMPVDVQNAIKCRIGQDYPSPVIDHSFARQRTLAVYKEARDAF